MLQRWTRTLWSAQTLPVVLNPTEQLTKWLTRLSGEFWFYAFLHPVCEQLCPVFLYLVDISFLRCTGVSCLFATPPVALQHHPTAISILTSHMPQPFSIERSESGSTQWSKGTIITNESSNPDLYLNLTKHLCLFTPNEVRNNFQDDPELQKVLFQAPVIRELSKLLQKECLFLLILFIFTLV